MWVWQARASKERQAEMRLSAQWHAENTRERTVTRRGYKRARSDTLRIQESAQYTLRTQELIADQKYYNLSVWIIRHVYGEYVFICGNTGRRRSHCHCAALWVVLCTVNLVKCVCSVWCSHGMKQTRRCWRDVTWSRQRRAVTRGSAPEQGLRKVRTLAMAVSARWRVSKRYFWVRRSVEDWHIWHVSTLQVLLCMKQVFIL